ncbi:MAG: aliphatic sulfonate transporter substrate-binding protein [Sphingomonas bacterium]|nr:aliphatic sulfonate transporter substrate-binding protein [Sphingomonas bacterium]
MTVVRIVLHQNSLSLHVLHKLGVLDNRLAKHGALVEWVTIGGGARTPDYLGADLADIGGTGSTPPLTGQGNGVPLVYIAGTLPRDFGGIAVRADSSIASIADLKGARIAHSGGSWHQTLIATALKRAGLSWSDVIPLDLPEPVSKERLLAGAVDAWASGEIVGANTEKLRFLATTSDVFVNRFIFFARREFAERYPELLDEVVQAIEEAEQWINHNPRDAARILIETLKRDTEAHWLALLTSRTWGLVAVDDTVLDEQQAAADVLHPFGLIARRIDVRDATLARPVAVRVAA